VKVRFQDLPTSQIVVSWVCQLVACGFLGWAGYLKLTGHPAEVELFDTLGMGDFGRQVVGALEVLAVVLLLIPQSGVYGALLGVGLMCGAVIAHATKIGFGGPFPLALLVLACCLVVLYLRRNEAEFLRNLIDR
jgi:hypothetical protein